MYLHAAVPPCVSHAVEPRVRDCNCAAIWYQSPLYLRIGPWRGFPARSTAFRIWIASEIARQVGRDPERQQSFGVKARNGAGGIVNRSPAIPEKNSGFSHVRTVLNLME